MDWSIRSFLLSFPPLFPLLTCCSSNFVIIEQSRLYLRKNNGDQRATYGYRLKWQGGGRAQLPTWQVNGTRWRNWPRTRCTRPRVRGHNAVAWCAGWWSERSFVLPFASHWFKQTYIVRVAAMLDGWVRVRHAQTTWCSAEPTCQSSKPVMFILGVKWWPIFLTSSGHSGVRRHRRVSPRKKISLLSDIHTSVNKRHTPVTRHMLRQQSLQVLVTYLLPALPTFHTYATHSLLALFACNRCCTPSCLHTWPQVMAFMCVVYWSTCHRLLNTLRGVSVYIGVYIERASKILL